MARDANNEILSRRDFNKLVCCLAEEIGGGASLPAGTLNDTLRYDGTNWVADSFLSNSSSLVSINGYDSLLSLGQLGIQCANGANGGLWVLKEGGGAYIQLNVRAGSNLNSFGNNFSLQKDGTNRLSVTSFGIGVGTASASLVQYSLDGLLATDGWRFAQGTTAQRPTHAAGVMRWNSDTGSFEFSDGAAWNNFVVGPLQNFATANLNLTGNRVHSLSGNSLEIGDTTAKLIIDEPSTNLGAVVKLGDPLTPGNPGMSFYRLPSIPKNSILDIRAEGSNSSPILSFSRLSSNSYIRSTYAQGFVFGSDTPSAEVKILMPTWTNGLYISSPANSKQAYLYSAGNNAEGDLFIQTKLAGVFSDALRLNRDLSAYFYGPTALQLHKGTTAQRPTHSAGKLRWNTDTAEFEYSDGAAWNSLGGGLVNWTEGFDSTTQATSSFTPLNAATDVNAAIVPKGTGALVLSIPDGTTTGGNSRGANAIDLQIKRSASNQIAEGAGSVQIGSNNRTTSIRGVSIGVSNINTSLDGYVLGNTNTVGRNASYIFGLNNSITTAGNNNTIIGQHNSITGGTNSLVLGTFNTTSTSSTVTIGRYAIGKLSLAKAYSSERFTVVGDAQEIVFTAGKDCVGSNVATHTLTLDKTGTTVLPTIPNNTIWTGTVSGHAVTYVQGTGGTAVAGEASGHYLTFTLKNLGGTVTLVGSAGTYDTKVSDTNMADDQLRLLADDTNDSLAIQYTPPSGAVADTETRVHVVVRITETAIPVA